MVVRISIDLAKNRAIAASGWAFRKVSHKIKIKMSPCYLIRTGSFSALAAMATAASAE
jgi:hypothetical protein